MRKFSYSIFLLSFILLIPFLGYGQTMVIQPYGTTGQTLNQTIMGDTSATGQRQHTQYLLVRDSLYLIDAPFQNNGWALNIGVQDGSGGKPVIMFIPPSGSTSNPGYFIQNSGDVILKNLIVSTYFEYDPTQIGQMHNMISTSAVGTNITIDSCIMLNVTGQIIRTGSAAKNIKLTNCIFGNMGYEGTSNFGAGKGLDLRDGSCDTLLIQNCTFVNLQDRVIRHLNSTATLNHFIFDHNTVVNAMSYHGMLSLGWVGAQVQITNNMFVDPFAAAQDTDVTRQAEFITHEQDPWGGNRMTWIFTDTSGGNTSTTFTIKNNYYAISDSGNAWYTRWSSQLPSEYGLPPEGAPLTWYINKKLGADSVNAFKKDENIKLKNTPHVMTAMLDWYRTPVELGGAGKTKATTTWNESYDYDRRSFQYFKDTLDCSYTTSLPSYAAADGGYPVGDLNWFPDKHAAWILNPTAVERDNHVVVTDYKLDQNYPNPFNPSTVISYSIPKASVVSLIIYNALGQQVLTLVNNENQISGKYNVTWNGKDAAGRTLASGIYFYQLRTNNMTLSKKMMLLK